MGAGVVLGVPVFAGADDKPDTKQACIAAAEQGQSLRDDGKYRGARESFVSCSQDTCPRVVAQSCTKWLREIDESAPTVVLGAKDEQGNDLTDVKVSLDGAPFASQLDGKPLIADTGEHLLRFERERSVAVEQKVLLRAGERTRVVSVTLRSINALGGAEEDASTETPEQPAAPPEPVLSAHHVVAASITLGALAAAGTAIFFYVQSGNEKNSANDLKNNTPALSDTAACNPSPPAMAPAACGDLRNHVNAQHNDMNTAIGLFAGAGGLALGAVATWIFWPKPHAPEAEPPASGALVPVPGGAMLSVTGRF